MKKIFFITIIAFTFIITKVNAQDLANYNLYMQNYYLYNPAYTYNTSCYNVYLNTHQQWVGFTGAPTSYNFGAYGPVFKNSGLGITLDRKQSGILTNTSAFLNYSYRAYFADDHFLALGVSLGMINDKVDQSVVTQQYINDPELTSNTFNSYNVTGNFGLGYQFKNFEAQIVLPQMFQRKDMNFYTLGILAYNYQINDQIKIKPSVLARGVNISPYQVEGSILVDYNDFVWGQLGYRSNNSSIFSVGFKFSGITIGYAYQADYSLIGKSSKGTHEIQLIYNFGSHICDRKPSKIPATGIVKDAYSKKAIQNADVIIYNDRGEEIFRTKTDENGFYKTCELKFEQTHKIQVIKDDYSEKSEMLTIQNDEMSKTMNIELTPEKVFVDGSIVPPFAEIVVTDNNGNIVYSGTADENGNYRFEAEYGQTYTVKATAEGYEAKTEKYEVKPGSNNNKIEMELIEYKNLTAVLKNKDNNEAISAKVTLKDENGKLIESKQVNGEYKISLLPGVYSIEFSDEKILPLKEEIEIKQDTDKEYTITFKLKPLSENKTFSLGSVNFETGKSIIKEESYHILDELVEIMEKSPELKIQIEGHTDNVGSATNNQILSQNRAQACMDYAVDKGISADRLKAVGYGEAKPIVPNDTPENRAKNRRTEFKIID